MALRSGARSPIAQPPQSPRPLAGALSGRIIHGRRHNGAIARARKERGQGLVTPRCCEGSRRRRSPHIKTCTYPNMALCAKRRRTRVLPLLFHATFGCLERRGLIYAPRPRRTRDFSRRIWRHRRRRFPFDKLTLDGPAICDCAPRSSSNARETGAGPSATLH